jgi:hypothetical protein
LKYACISHEINKLSPTKKQNMEKYAIIFGSNMFVGTNGILTVEINGELKEFFRIREIFSEPSKGSHLTVDCDIKDTDNTRQIKLHKSRPVVKDDKIIVEYNQKLTHIKREDNSTVIKIEQIENNDLTLPQEGPVFEFLRKEKLDVIIRITGNFYAGPFKLMVDNQYLRVGGITLGGNLSVRTGGLMLTSMGFSM